MPKPSDVFVGVIAFFSVLLPGALLTGTLLIAVGPALDPRVPRLFSSQAAQAVAFFTVAYTLGHLLFGLAAFVDGTVYDRYRLIRWPKSGDLAYLEASILRAEYMGRCEQGGAEPIRTFNWAKALLRLRAPNALADVERYEADSKFFRSLIIALPLCAILLVAGGGYSRGGVAMMLAAALVLSLLSFHRYADRRYKSAQWSYYYAIVLQLGAPAAAVIADPGRHDDD